MENKTILVIGCSFSASGNHNDANVNDTSVPIHPRFSWPRLISERLNCRVVNASVPGTSLAFHASIYERLIEQHKPDLVLFQITYSTRTTITTSKNIEHDLLLDCQWENYHENYQYILYSSKQYFDNNSDYHLTNEFDGMDWQLPTDWTFLRFCYSWPQRYKMIYQLFDNWINESSQNKIFDVDHQKRPIWLNEIEKNQYVEPDFYRKKLELMPQNQMQELMAMAVVHYSLAHDEGNHITQKTFEHIIAGIKYKLNALKIPHVIFSWDSLTEKNVENKIVPINDTILYPDNCVNFSVYDSIPDRELYALDRMLHLDRHGHEKVADLVNKYIKTVLNDG